jgi:hypothetical protein
MPRTEIAVEILRKEQAGTETMWTVKFTNKSKILAFFVNPRLMNGTEEVLPSFWSANYFSLAPGESMVAKVSASDLLLKGKTQQLTIKGWNITEHQLKLN